MARTARIALLMLLCLVGLRAGAAQIGPTKFDHLTTGFELVGAHLNVPCESCHVGAIFKGTSRDCASCHTRGSRISATVKPQNHVLSTERCEACHNTVAWKPTSHFDHQEVQGSCATCHNGINAQGKTLNHIASTLECEACHSVFGWKPVIRVDHLQVNGTCTNCHDGKTATGKTANHIATTESCDNCHSTFQWKPANVKHTGDISNCVACHNGQISTGKTQNHIRSSDQCAACHTVVVWKPVVTVDHTQVSGTCFSCHNGTIAKGKSTNHPATDNNCESCHATTAFRPANVSHTGITDNCVSCHNGKTATGKTANHINTTDACQACHSVIVWKPQVTVDHTQVNGACASCHNGSIAMGRAANHIPASADCGVCHLSTVVFGPGTVMNHQGITSGCSACHEGGKTWLGVTNMVTRPTKAQDPNHPATGDCSQCHSSTTSFMVDVTGGKPVNHIPTSQACNVCHADSGDYSLFKMNHVGISSNCAQCHAKGLSFANIVPKQPPANHIPTTTACESCHSPTKFDTFAGTVMNHTGINNNCQTCHETGMTWFGVTMVDRPTKAQDPNHPTTGDCAQCHTSTTSFAVVSAGKPANHIPTTQACTLCHSNANDYSIYKMDHKGITNGCATCHAAGLSFANIVPKQPPANHFPIAALPCENCHSPTNFGAFGPGTPMKHTGITGNCATCHETGMTWYGVTMVDRPTKAQDPNHPATGECANCHTSTVSFASGVIGGNKPSNHIPTTQACDLCHSNSKDYSIYTMNHTGITGNCAQCHAAGLSFANIVPKAPPSTHLPINSKPCETCHSPTKFTNFAGTTMNHTGITRNCTTCHETGMSWFGVTMVNRPTAAQDPNHPKTGDCADCHSSTVSFTTGLAKPPNHIPTTQACTLCHTSPNNYAVYTMNHTGITNNCDQCHASGLSFANIVPKQPPSNHIPVTGLACENCHSPTKFTSFAGAVMSHTGIVSNCSQCHETGKTFFGVTMVTRPTAAQDPNHPTTGDCHDCHASTVSFAQGITVKPANHIPTSQPCATCHTNPNDYSVYTMNHVGITTNCAQCHAKGLSFANIVPKQPPANHIPSTTPCENCHSPTKFTAFGPGTPMSHTGIVGNCATCHEKGMSWFGVTIVTRPTTAQDPNHPQTGECSNCHSSTTSFAGGVATKPANHIPTTQACTLCHSNPADYKVYKMNHQGITNNCAVCHGKGLSFANIVPKQPPSNHIPSTTPCENCHSPTNFTAFGPGTPMSHTGINGACASCHEKGMTWLGVTIVTRPTTAQDPNHPATGECSNCHTSTTSFSAGITVKPSNHIPTSQACTLCHSNANDYSIYKMNHQGITSNCAQCHGAGLTFANITPKHPPSNHIPYKTVACESCHSKTNFTTFGGTAMKHTAVSSFTCVTCHETGMSWYGVRIVVRPKGHHGTTDCKGCHDTVNFGNADGKLGRTGKTTPATATTATTSKAPVNGVNATTANGKGPRGGAADAALREDRDPHDVAPGRFNLAGQMARMAALRNAGIAPGGAAQGIEGKPFSHAGTLRACSTCHNGLTAAGKSPRHIPSNNSCDNCHTVNAWLPARFEHIGVAATCAQCHDSVHTTGKPANHVQTQAACNNCHSTMAWLPVIFRHSGITGDCQSCHGRAGAIGKPLGHMTTSLDCAACHNVNVWTPVVYRHVSPNYPGEHRAELTCVQCHSTNTDKIPWTSPGSAPACAGCHERNYKPAPHIKYGKVTYTAAELRNCAGSCHVYSDDTLKAVIKPRPGPQHQVSSGQF